jgi:hypothetical protein
MLNASEKKVWKTPMPTWAGSAVTLRTPPIEAMSSVVIPVTTARITGVRERRALCFSSRIHTGLGFRRSRCTIHCQRANRPALGGSGATEGECV